MKKKTKIILPTIADPTEANPDHPLCSACQLDSDCKIPYMPAFVPPGWTGRILVIGEAPGANEDIDGRAFTGRAGQKLYKLFDVVGIQPQDIALTNANRCRPINNATPLLKQIRLCRPFLLHDILRLHPKWVLCLGDNAAKAITNNGKVSARKLRGRALNGKNLLGEDYDGIWITGTYHPASTLYAGGKEREDQIRSDLQWLISWTGYVADPVATQTFPENPKFVTFDIEWDKNYKLLTASRAAKDGEGYAVEVTEDNELCQKWLNSVASQQTILNGHSVFGDLNVLQLNGMKLPVTLISGQSVLDSLLIARLADENLENYDLENLAVSQCRVEPWKSESDSLQPISDLRDFAKLPPNIRQARCLKDSWTADQVLRHNLQILKKELLPPKLVRFCHILAAALKRVELAGVKTDSEHYKKISKLLESQVQQRGIILKELGTINDIENFEPKNDHHFRELLFDKLKADVYRKTEKDKLPAIDKPTLILMYQQADDTIKDAILKRLRYEKAEKLYSTYVVGVGKRITVGGYIHQHINPLGADTGRRSSSNPNLQNWPKRIRKMIVSRYKGGSIVMADESQLEPRIMAHVAQIPEWLEIFHRGGNLYLETAKKIWNKEIEKDSGFYKLAKSTILGTNYGMEVDLFQEKLSTEQGLHLSRTDAQWLLTQYHSLYPELPRFFALQKERIIATGYVESLTGQRRRLLCPEGEKTKGFKHLWNMAVNFPIQCLAAYITGSALIDLENVILAHVGVSLEEHYANLTRHWGLQNLDLTLPPGNEIMNMGREIDYPLIVNEVHDELDIDVPEKDISWLPDMAKEVMETCPTLRKYWPETKQIILKADLEIKPHWV